MSFYYLLGNTFTLHHIIANMHWYTWCTLQSAIPYTSVNCWLVDYNQLRRPRDSRWSGHALSSVKQTNIYCQKHPIPKLMCWNLITTSVFKALYQNNRPKQGVPILGMCGNRISVRFLKTGTEPKPLSDFIIVFFQCIYCFFCVCVSLFTLYNFVQPPAITFNKCKKL